jgi:hypothetical protein
LNLSSSKKKKITLFPYLYSSPCHHQLEEEDDSFVPSSKTKESSLPKNHVFAPQDVSNYFSLTLFAVIALICFFIYPAQKNQYQRTCAQDSGSCRG